MKTVLLYAGIPLSILLLWLALKDVDFLLVSQAFANAKLVFIIPMLICLASFYYLKALRWSTILSPRQSISAAQLTPSMMAGAAGNNLLPAHAGELVRVYFSATQFSVPKTTILASLLLERLMDMLAVLLIFSVAILLGGYSSSMITAAYTLLAIVIVASAFCGFIVIYTHQSVEFIRHKCTKPSENIRYRIADQLENVVAGLASLREQKLYLNVITNSLAQWLFMAACIYCSFCALNISAPFSLAVVILGLIVAGLTLPTVPGFFGIIEYCFVLGMGTAGIDPSVAISAGIFYHIPAWIGVTSIGLLLAHHKRYSFRRLKSITKNP